MTKRKPMKITLLTNLSGEIVGARYRAGAPGESSPIATQINTSPEQRVHEIDIPAELHSHVLEGTLVSEIFKYRVEGVGKRAKLVRASANKARKGPRTRRG
jgi:hypothetical protein